MRIISDFRDFYDVAQSFGQDQTRIYKRIRKEILLEKNPGIPYIYSYSQQNSHISYNQTIIGFCGKLYPVIEINKVGSFGCLTKEDRATRKFCFSLEDIDAWVKANIKEKDQEGYFHPKSSSSWKRYRSSLMSEACRPDFHHLFEKSKEFADKFNDLFVEYACPVLSFKSEKKETYLILNPCLRDVEFYRLFDPYQAFQEIAMFFGNLAEPRKPIPQIDDQTIMEIKGFDKYSFRKDPSKNKFK